MTTTSITQSKNDKVITTIPSISERRNRPCDTCVWTPDMYDCRMCELDYEMPGERTSGEYSTYVLSYSGIQQLPCRFHLTADELKCILDPYFME